MSDPQFPDNYDRIIARLIRSMAARLAGSGPANEHDQEDLAQDCRLELLRKLGRIDPSRGKPDAFVGSVLRNFLANLRRNRNAQRRDPRRVTSLGGPERVDRFSEAANDRHRRLRRMQLEDAELRQDLQTALEQLPPKLLDLALRLMRQSVAEAARDLGVPRTTLQSRLAKLRAVFERHNLRDYLFDTSSFRD